MHITLILKPDAGDGRHSLSDLAGRLREAGHEVVDCLRKDEWIQALHGGTELVLIAGGDGTVAKVTRRLLGTTIPFAIIPLGTANNIANELGWCFSPEDVVPVLDEAILTPFDVGVAAGPWGTWRFIEGAGTGPFPRTMGFVSRNDGTILQETPDRMSKLGRDLRLIDAFLMESSPEDWNVEIDGVPHEGPHLLVEVMNAGRIGPNLQLAPDSSTSDGMLDVVLVSETERARLHDYLAARMEGPASPPSLPVHRGRHVRLTVEAARVHVDDTLWPAAKQPPPASGVPFTMEFRVEPGALHALVPAGR